MAANNNIIPPIFQIYGISPLMIPLSTMSAISVGKYKSDKDCIKTNANTTRIGSRKGFKYLNNFIILFIPIFSQTHVYMLKTIMSFSEKTC
ncbi:hypothetical protein D3C75_865680 [compost metagenome]